MGALQKRSENPNKQIWECIYHFNKREYCGEVTGQRKGAKDFEGE